jgi:hypothetical protein
MLYLLPVTSKNACPSLTILNIAQSDEANYICSATNIAGTSSSQQAFLDVTGSKYSMYFKHRLICKKNKKGSEENKHVICIFNQ